MFAEIPLLATLPASDLQRAVAWYAEKLHLAPVRTIEDGAAEYETGGVRFVVYTSNYAGTNQATAATFTVMDFEPAVTQLRRDGVVFEDYDFGELKTVEGILTFGDGTKAAWFKDSEGNILALAQG